MKGTKMVFLKIMETKTVTYTSFQNIPVHEQKMFGLAENAKDKFITSGKVTYAVVK